MIEDQAAGLNRRDVLRRGAILGGALVWTVPAVQTLAGPAFAAGTACVGRVEVTTTGTPSTPASCAFVEFQPSNECCDCITSQTGVITGPVAALLAVLACHSSGACQISSVGTC